MPKLTEYEKERLARMEKNKAMFQEMGGVEAVNAVTIKKPNASAGSSKQTQPNKRPKRDRAESDPEPPRRQSSRLKRTSVDPNETPAQKKKRVAEEENQRRLLEDQRLEAEERARVAKKPRHDDLDLVTLTDGYEEIQLRDLSNTLQSSARSQTVKSEYVFHETEQEKTEVAALKSKLRGMKIVSQAKVTNARVYSSAFHPCVDKDLVFFGDKSGQLGIWDARAPPEEVENEDGEIVQVVERGAGKSWKVQPHWPAKSDSSISCIKVDPVNSNFVLTGSYDSTIRRLAFDDGRASEVFAMDGTLITSMDLVPNGNELWISDDGGGVSHLDLREDKSKARRWQLSDKKIGCVSVNPASPNSILASSNNRTMKIWDARQLKAMPTAMGSEEYPATTDLETIETHIKSDGGRNTLLMQHPHGKSVSSAYWDPRGQRIVSTCYDDRLRLWDVGAQVKQSASYLSHKPFCSILHNCQCGRWVSVLKAQWSPNPGVYPHFTIGNMKHSLDIFSCKGELLARLEDKSITAVQAVTCSHPRILERAASGSASGKCILWAPPSDE